MIAAESAHCPHDENTPEAFVRAVIGVHEHTLAKLHALIAGTVLPNTVRAARDAEIIRRYCARHGLNPAGSGGRPAHHPLPAYA
ncbi:MAG TPA: hypothetical protein VKV57_17640 [bacterium]|nr:hypothetical protein [bacterium]